MELAEKFLFETTFDKADGGRDPGSKGSAELDESYRRGYQMGSAETKKTIEQEVATAETVIAERLSNLDELRDGFHRQTVGKAVTIALELTAKMMPALASTEGFDEIETLIEECLHRLMAEPRVVFRVPDKHLDLLRDKLAGLSQKTGYQGQTVLIADADLGPSDCRIEWADGGTERDLSALWREIEETIMRAMGTTQEPVADAAPEAATPAVKLDEGQGT